MSAKKEILEKIAKNILCLDTLETRNSDQLDFAEHSVWQVKSALTEAFHSGEILASAAQNEKIVELEKKIAKLEKQAVLDSWTISPEQMGR